MLGCRIKFARIGIRKTQLMAGVFNDSNLHAQADAQIRQIVFPTKSCRHDFPFDAPVSETARYDDTLTVCQNVFHIPFVDCFGVDPLDVHEGFVPVSGMTECFCHRQIRVMKLHILAHQSDGNLFLSVSDRFQHSFPFCHIRLRQLGKAQFPADHVGEALAFQHHRCFIKNRHCHIFKHAVPLHIAEEGDFIIDGFIQRFVAAKDHNPRHDAHAPQLLDRVLRRLCLQFLRTAQVRYQADVDEEAVLRSHFQSHLTDGFQKRLTFNVAGGAADFRDDHVGICLSAYSINKLLDLVGNMRDHLDGLSQVFAAAFLIEHIPVDLSCGQIAVFIQIFVDEAFIMSKVQVGLRAVLCHIHFPMLVRAHGSRIHVDIRVQLLCRHLQSSGLQQPPQGCCRNAFSQSRYYAAGHKDILGSFHFFTLLQCQSAQTVCSCKKRESALWDRDTIPSQRALLFTNLIIIEKSISVVNEFMTVLWP